MNAIVGSGFFFFGGFGWAGLGWLVGFGGMLEEAG